jgi:sporulation protein YabP
MAEEKKGARQQHHVIMEGRRTLVITGVTDIDSFDEQMVAVFTDVGELIARGSGLHINKIDVDSGELSLDGEIDSLEYTDNVASRGGLWSRLFR